MSRCRPRRNPDGRRLTRPAWPGRRYGVPVLLHARRRLLFLASAAIAVTATAFAVWPTHARRQPLNRLLPWHAARLDARGELQPWYRPDRGLGYDHVLRLGWSFLERRIPDDAKTRRKVYLAYAVFDERTRQGTYWQHNPASLYASFVESLLPWYAYSGDRRAIAVVREMLDYALAYGTTPNRWAWPDVPFPTSCAGERTYGRCLAGMPRTFYGGVEPDKVGLLGLGYARFYELTGERRYLTAAVRCADALARNVRPGDATHTPWPFRVDGRTGRTLERAEYGGMIVAPVWLFDELARLHVGKAAAYERAHRIAWRWLLDYPLNPSSTAANNWSGHYEDIDYDPGDLNQAAPTMTALYLLMHPNPERVDPHWRSHVSRLLAWVRAYFGRGPFHGAWAIDEQRNRKDGFSCCSDAGLSSDTARWAAAEALDAERTGRGDAGKSARLSLAYATYFMRADGAVSCCGTSLPQAYWFSDGYADYLQSFSWALGVIPRLAPPGQDHLLRSTSVVQSISYDAGQIGYRTFAPHSIELLRLSFRPAAVLADGRRLRQRADLRGQGYTTRPLGHGDLAVTIRHDHARRIRIR